MTVILQGGDGEYFGHVAIDLSPKEAEWLTEKMNPALAELQLRRQMNRGIQAVAVPDESYCNSARSMI